MYVKDCMYTTVTTVTPDTLVGKAYQMMHSERIRHLPVVTDAQTLVGIITDRDIRRAAASDAPHMAEYELTYLLDKLQVRDIMTPEVVTVHDTTPLMEAGQIFLQKKFGCLPVVRDHNTLAGIITVTDLLRAYSTEREADGEMIPIRNILQTQVITATPEMSLAEAQRLMRANHIRHLPVMSEQRLVGMLTDRDIREAAPSPATTLARGEITYQMEMTAVKTCMTRDVVCLGPDSDMVQAVREIVQRKIGCLPVVEQDTLVGVVTDMDCLRAFLDTASDA